MKKNIESNKINRVIKIKLSSKDDINNYLSEICKRSKELYNAMNYYCRQVYFYCGKSNDINNLNENTIQAYEKLISSMNRINSLREAGLMKGKPLKLPNPEKHMWLLNFATLDVLGRELAKDEYYNISSAISQPTMRDLAMHWERYVQDLSKIKKGGSNLKKRKPPQYYTDIFRTTKVRNDCGVIKINNETKEKFLKFPKLKDFDTGGKCPEFHHQVLQHIPDDWKHMSTTIIPDGETFSIALCFELPDEKIDLNSIVSNRIIGIDPGGNNFATIANNFGENPIIINGRPIINSNEFWNRNNNHYKSVLMHGHDPKSKNCQKTSKRLRRNSDKRNRRVDDFIHKASKYIVDYCKENNVDTIVIGQTKGWKSEINIGHENNRKFVQVPHGRFITKLEYKAEESGIKIIKQEESYSSKASFLDEDHIPEWGSAEYKECNGEFNFSGKRIKRGLYKAGDGFLVNADVNGAANIIRKAFPDLEVDALWIEGVKKSPQRVNIL